MNEESDSKLILIIEDESDFVVGLTDAFEFEGYRVTSADNGDKGITMAAELHPDIIILDLMLPDINGYQVCEQIRRRDKITPILILSARSQEADIVRGLESGADDYVTKPFSIAELQARVKTIFRRTKVPSKEPNEKIIVGEAAVSIESHSITSRGRIMQMSFYETAILQLLHENRGRVITRDEILDNVWGFDANPTNRTIDNFIMKLRRKLEQDPSNPKYILTVYGQGYKLVDEV